MIEARRGLQPRPGGPTRIGNGICASPVETAVISIKPGPASAVNPLPSITSLSPSSAPVGASSQTVSIRGNYLLTTSTVAVNNIERTFTIGSDYGLTITLNSSDLAQAGPLVVAVTNPAPGGGTSEAIFMAGTGNIQPKVTSLNPSSAVVGANLPVLTVLGEYFLPNPTVTLNGSPRSITTPSDAGRLTVVLNASDLAKAGVFPVVVTNPGGSASSAFNFTVLDAKPSQPAIISVSTTKRVYVVGDQFSMTYTTLAGAASGTFDLMIKFLSLASGNTYYYYDDPSDSNSEWLHSTPVPRGRGSRRRAVYHPGRQLGFPGHQRCTDRRLPHQSLLFEDRRQPAGGRNRRDRFLGGDRAHHQEGASLPRPHSALRWRIRFSGCGHFATGFFCPAGPAGLS